MKLLTVNMWKPRCFEVAIVNIMNNWPSHVTKMRHLASRRNRPRLWCNLQRAWTNDKCLATKHHQTLFGDHTFYLLDTLFGAVWSCLYVFDRVWSCLIKFEGHQTFNQQLKTFLLFSCLMSDVLFVWTATYQTCLMRVCVPRLLSGLYQLFDLCLIKHVLIVWPLTSTLSCLVTKQSLMV